MSQDQSPYHPYSQSFINYPLNPHRQEYHDNHQHGYQAAIKHDYALLHGHRKPADAYLPIEIN
jgi:hypothetical protein